MADKLNPSSDFPKTLAFYCERDGRSRNKIAEAAGCDPSHITRMVHGHRSPPAYPILASLAYALKLSRVDEARLFVAAGYAPPSLETLGKWDEALDCVAWLLGNPWITDGTKDAFRETIIAMTEYWKHGVYFDKTGEMPSYARVIPPPPDTKVCGKCKRELPRSAFGPSMSNRDGLRPHCKPCRAEYERNRQKGVGKSVRNMKIVGGVKS